MSLAKALEGFRPITSEDSLDFSWYEGEPRFWQALSYLSTDKANLIGEVDGNQIVIRCKVLHGKVVAYLLFPPKDLNLIKHFSEFGISCKVTEKERDQFTCIADVGNIEYYYQWNEDTFGSIWKNFRYGKNLFHRLEERDLVSVTDPKEEALQDLVKRWYKQRKSVANTGKIVEKFFEVKKEKSFHCISDNENLIAASLVEKINENSGAIVCRIKDFENTKSVGLTNIIHYMDLELWKDLKLTIGSSVRVKGLSAHKNNLSPANKVQIYSVVPKRILNLKDYRDWKESLK